MMPEREFRGSEDLECYQLALKVLKEAYRVSEILPIEEKYNLSSQLCRSSTSILLNIAEGYGRYHYLDSLHFYYIARGSLMETLSSFILCNEIGYLNNQLENQRRLCHQALRSLSGYIRFIRNQRQGRQEYGDHSIQEIPSPYSVFNSQFGSDQSTKYQFTFRRRLDYQLCHN